MKGIKVMRYLSTRGDEKRISSAEAIVRGLSSDGGLFVPELFPCLSLDTINELVSEKYYKRAAHVMSLFLDDFSIEELDQYSGAAYDLHRVNGFSHSEIAPLNKIDNSTFFLELWHGPTCAFKDMALQVMPRLLTASLGKIGEKRDVCILVATSGDTGKAALDGFNDVPGTKILVFYPRDGVSKVQELQMTSQGGENTCVVAVDGNFDDTQAGVKAIFSDADLLEKLDGLRYFLSSANSINWGRLVPQISYYVSAYCDLLERGVISLGERINYCVPTGNFGNILAAYYSERMGLPINKLICASNRNDVLTQFINTGVYDKNRQFYTTVSPSMDILVSSNLERLLYELSGKDGRAVAEYMTRLSAEGRYEVSGSFCDELKRVFRSGFCSEEDTKKTIGDTFFEFDYLIDTHTAVAYKVLSDYRAATGDNTPAVVVSTASPFKFCEAVLEAVGRPQAEDGVNLIRTLSEATGCEVPAPLAALMSKAPRFTGSVTTSGMKAAVVDFMSK